MAFFRFQTIKKARRAKTTAISSNTFRSPSFYFPAISKRTIAFAACTHDQRYLKTSVVVITTRQPRKCLLPYMIYHKISADFRVLFFHTISCFHSPAYSLSTAYDATLVFCVEGERKRTRRHIRLLTMFRVYNRP